MAIFGFALCASLGRSACDQGLECYFNGYRGIKSVAFADSVNYSGSHYLELPGSFVTRISGSHEFKLCGQTYSWSVGWISESRFTFHGTDYRPDGYDWYQTLTLTKDFRYSMRLATTDHYFFVKVSIAVGFSGRPMSDLDGDLIATCEESGCRDLSLPRSPYNCQPSPSRIFSLPPSPTSTASHSPPLGQFIGIVIGCIVGTGIVILIIILFVRKRRHWNAPDEPIRLESELQSGPDEARIFTPPKLI
jgi:hypothetical protein